MNSRRYFHYRRALSSIDALEAEPARRRFSCSGRAPQDLLLSREASSEVEELDVQVGATLASMTRLGMVTRSTAEQIRQAVRAAGPEDRADLSQSAPGLSASAP